MGRATFSVLDEGWIPVIRADGSKDIVGIRETLKSAHMIREVSDANPLVEFGLYRLLSLFLMDALRPERLDDLDNLLEEGRFDESKIEAYISACREEGVSFDLFDEKTPFLQSPYNSQYDKEIKPIGTLDCTLPSGNNHTHFDHRRITSIRLDYATAARMLVPAYLFCTAGAQGYPSGMNGGPALFAVIKGDNLFESLLGLLVPSDEVSVDYDNPCVLWRENVPVTPKKNVVSTSLFRGLLFPTRRILLIPDEIGETVSSLYYSQGENYTQKETWTDPCVAYRYIDSGRIPLRAKQEKPVWRNITDLLDISHHHAPEILRIYRECFEKDMARITLYGVETNQASYLGIHRYNLDISMALTEEPVILDMLKMAIAHAEEMARTLSGSLSKGGETLRQTIPVAVQSYYTDCESKFFELLQVAFLEEDTGAVFRDWLDALLLFAVKAVDDIGQRSYLKGRDLAELADVYKSIFWRIKKLKEGIE